MKGVQRDDDPLSGLAPLLRVRPELQDFCQFGGIWAAPHEAAANNAAHFHIVIEGFCLLDLVGHEPLKLNKGDVLLLPHGSTHILHAPGSAMDAARPRVAGYRNAIRLKAVGDGEADTELVCGLLHFESASEILPVAALPDIIILRGGQDSAVARFETLIGGIREELDGSRAGANAIATDLASALFVMLLRAHLERHPPADGLLALLAQRPTAQAVIAMLREPARDWTLDELAAIAMTSRATLVRLFKRTCDLAPLGFLTDLRLGLGRQRLMETDEPIAKVAAALGYQSEATFSRAIYRKYGIRPGRLRSGGETPHHV